MLKNHFYNSDYANCRIAFNKENFLYILIVFHRVLGNMGDLEKLNFVFSFLPGVLKCIFHWKETKF